MSSVDEVVAVPSLVRHDRAVYRALAGESRQALLAVLHEVGGPLDAVDAGASVGLHPNTARVHREVLCSVGLVDRRTEDRSRRAQSCSGSTSVCSRPPSSVWAPPWTSSAWSPS
jgi:predicted transcriptional regulator